MSCGSYCYQSNFTVVGFFFVFTFTVRLSHAWPLDFKHASLLCGRPTKMSLVQSLPIFPPVD